MALLGLIVMCIISSLNAASLEPICSKFSYEEQLLEKMVRLEFFVENMDKDVKASVTENKKEMSDQKTQISKNLSATIENVDVKFENIKTNVTKAMRDQKLQISKNLTATIEDFGVKFETINTNVTRAMEKTKTTVRRVIAELESKVEEVLTNMTVRNDKMINEMNEDVKSVGKKFEDFKTFINEANDKFIKGINEEVKNIDKKVDDLKTNMEDNILKAIEDLMDKKFPVVAFNVYGTDKDYSGNVLPFKVIRLNEGGGFSTDTNKFTAPVTGIYQFNAHVCFEKGHEPNYYIQVGSYQLARGEYEVPNAASDGKCTSFSAVGLLQKSETAFVGGFNSAQNFVNTDDLNSFSGVLIRAV